MSAEGQHINKRNFEATVIAGEKRQGKSLLCEKYAKRADYYARLAEKEGAKPKKILIVDPSEASAFADFQPITLNELKFGTYIPGEGRRMWVRGIRRITHHDNLGLMRYLSDRFRNGLLISDEATTWLKANPPEWQKNLIIKHTNRCVDLLFVVHSLTNIPKSFRQHIWNYILFRLPDKQLSDPKNGLKWLITNNFPSPPELLKSYIEVESQQHDYDKWMQKYVYFTKSFAPTVDQDGNPIDQDRSREKQQKSNKKLKPRKARKSKK